MFVVVWYVLFIMCWLCLLVAIDFFFTFDVGCLLLFDFVSLFVCWLLAVGCWPLVVGRWLLFVFVVACCCLLVFVVVCFCRLLFVDCCVCVYCTLFVVWFVLSVVSCIGVFVFCLF